MHLLRLQLLMLLMACLMVRILIAVVRPWVKLCSYKPWIVSGRCKNLGMHLDMTWCDDMHVNVQAAVQGVRDVDSCSCLRTASWMCKLPMTLRCLYLQICLAIVFMKEMMPWAITWMR